MCNVFSNFSKGSSVVLPVVSAQIQYGNVMNSIYANIFYFSLFLQKNSFLFIDFDNSKLLGALREHHVFLHEILLQRGFVKFVKKTFQELNWCKRCGNKGKSRELYRCQRSWLNLNNNRKRKNVKCRSRERKLC